MCGCSAGPLSSRFFPAPRGPFIRRGSFFRRWLLTVSARHGWLWLAMVGQGRPWMATARHGWLWLASINHGWPLRATLCPWLSGPAKAGYCWPWLARAGRGWSLLATSFIYVIHQMCSFVRGCQGWPWLARAGHGWPGQAVAGPFAPRFVRGCQGPPWLATARHALSVVHEFHLFHRPDILEVPD